jgi:hypothetical protein
MKLLDGPSEWVEFTFFLDGVSKAAAKEFFASNFCYQQVEMTVEEDRIST